MEKMMSLITTNDRPQIVTKAPRIIECRVCGIQFPPTGTNARYCSEACRSRHYKLARRDPSAENVVFERLIAFLEGKHYFITSGIIARSLSMSGQKVSKSLLVLHQRGVIVILRKGKKLKYRLKSDT